MKKLTHAIVTLGWLGACTVGPDYEPPQIDMPDDWYTDLSHGLGTEQDNLHQWWSTFGDPVLESLIARLAQGNLDLEIAYQRIVESRAQLGIATGERYPDIDAFGDAFVAQESERRNPLLGGDTLHAYRIGADAVWEIDLWGRITRSLEAADASLQATVENYRDVLVVLYAEVAFAYFELRALQERIRLAEANVTLQQRSVELTDDRFAAQLASQLDVQQALLNIGTTKAFVPVLYQRRNEVLHRLAVLLGEHPGALNEELNQETQLPPLPENVAVSLPAELLRQRPDLRRAERELAAQTALIGVATAELYPQFSLFGSISYDGLNGNIDDSFGSQALAYSFGPQFRWNLFDGGRVQGNIDVQESRAAELLAAYRQTVLLALEEVENALTAYTQELVRRDALAQAVDAARQSVGLARDLYLAGGDFLNVLDMERSLVAQEDAMAESEGLVVQNLVRLYKALGGGWDPGSATDPTEPEADSGDEGRADGVEDPEEAGR